MSSESAITTNPTSIANSCAVHSGVVEFRVAEARFQMPNPQTTTTLTTSGQWRLLNFFSVAESADTLV